MAGRWKTSHWARALLFRYHFFATRCPRYFSIRYFRAALSPSLNVALVSNLDAIPAGLTVTLASLNAAQASLNAAQASLSAAQASLNDRELVVRMAVLVWPGQAPLELTPRDWRIVPSDGLHLPAGADVGC
jgi:hypothetical protein